MDQSLKRDAAGGGSSHGSPRSPTLPGTTLTSGRERTSGLSVFGGTGTPPDLQSPPVSSPRLPTRAVIALTLRSKGRCAIKPRSAPELERYVFLVHSMLTTEQKNLIEQAAERTYKRHISDLLAANEWVKKLDPTRPNAAGVLYEGFLKDTYAAINSYEEELVSEVIRVTKYVLPTLSRSEIDQLHSRCCKFIEPSLYENRIRLFRDALNRHASRYGINI
jgi:hypothetical protein